LSYSGCLKNSQLFRKFSLRSGDTPADEGGDKRMTRLRQFFLVGAVCAFTLAGCKPKEKQVVGEKDSEVAFVPVVAGAAYGVGITLEAAAAVAGVSAVYAADCTRPVAQGEIRFFCDGAIRLGQAAANIVVKSVQGVASALSWSHANIVSYLSSLSASGSNNVLRTALAGAANPQNLAGAKVSPEIKSASGLANLVHGLKQSIRIEDREKKSCSYIAQYEARLIPRDYRGNWLSGTSVRFFAKASSPASAEAMAKYLCEEYSEVHFKLPPPMAPHMPKSMNACRKPSERADYKERYRTEGIKCPGARACTSETECFDIL
jgi:hypothetical protein